MDKRHSSPSSRARSPRPRAYRKRSNSFPISEALGCSTTEAELLLAEGRAAIRSRLVDRSRPRSRRDNMQPFNPKHHIAFLVQPPVAPQAAPQVHGPRDALSPPAPKHRHARIPSDVTVCSTSTIVAPDQLALHEPSNDHTQANSPLGDYSAQLAKFIKSQLNSIPTYASGESSISPRSCPDLSFAHSPSLRSPALPPAKTMSMKRHTGAPSMIQIPSVRPPERSAFSEWSSTDDETDDEAPPTPEIQVAQEAPKAGSFTPVLRYYEQSNSSSFLFTSTPEGDDQDRPDTAKAPKFPAVPSSAEGHDRPPFTRDEDCSSPESRLSLLSASSAPSLSSTSTASYFETKMPLPQVPDMRNRTLAVVTPPPEKVISAISPFEGTDLANVHDILVRSQRSVLVDGMSFDMVRDFAAPDERMCRYQTQC